MKIQENPLINEQNENYLTYIRDYTESIYTQKLDTLLLHKPAFPGFSRLCTQPAIPAHDSTISFTVRTLTLQTCSTHIPHK